MLHQTNPNITFDNTPTTRPITTPNTTKPITTILTNLRGAPQTSIHPTITHPLQNIQILDFSNYFTTTYKTKLLSNLNTNIIKIKTLNNNPIQPLPNPFKTYQQNKRSIALDLKHPTALTTTLDLIHSTNMIIHNFQPNKTKKLNINYEQLQTIKPNLIYYYLPNFNSTKPKSLYKSFTPLLSNFTNPLYKTTNTNQPPIHQTINNKNYNNNFINTITILITLKHHAHTNQKQHLKNPQLHSNLLIQTHQQLDPNNNKISNLQLNTNQFN